VVDDGQIIVLGGLIEDRYTDNRSKVPLLGDIPVVGALFRSETRQKRRTNLMVFLRPVVMRDSRRANKLSLDRYDSIRGQQQAAQPPHSCVPDQRVAGAAAARRAARRRAAVHAPAAPVAAAAPLRPRQRAAPAAE
jgi:general secretion pathway protein D